MSSPFTQTQNPAVCLSLLRSSLRQKDIQISSRTIQRTWRQAPMTNDAHIVSVALPLRLENKHNTGRHRNQHVQSSWHFVVGLIEMQDKKGRKTSPNMSPEHGISILNTRAINLGPCRKRRRGEDLVDASPGDQDMLLGKSKRKKGTCENLFDSHMPDDIFQLLLRFFVSDSGAVDGESFRSITLVSKRWRSAVNEKTLWNISGDSLGERQHHVHRIARRPSPLIRDVGRCPQAAKFGNLIGFVNTGRRPTDDGTRSYTVCERSTGKLYDIDILDADDNRIIHSAASAHYVARDKFLSNDTDTVLFLPIGLESFNSRVVRWFERMDSLKDVTAVAMSRHEPFDLKVVKHWFRQLLVAAHTIHRNGAIHGHISTENVYIDHSSKSPRSRLKLACPSLFPIVSYWTPSANSIKYSSPELLIHLSKGLSVQPTPASDVWSIGCVMAEVIRCGVPLFVLGPNRCLEEEGNVTSWSRHARTVCRLVGSPSLGSSYMQSMQSNKLTSDATGYLKRELKELDTSGLDLIKKMLSVNPEKRPTVEEALTHPFLSNGGDIGFVPSGVDGPLGRERVRTTILVSRESQDKELRPMRKHVCIEGWASLVDYVVEIVEVFDLRIEAAFRAMTYFDQFVSSYQGPAPFTSRRCQLVVGTCLYIACKCDDMEISKIDLALCADNIFDHHDISIAEKAILHALDWKLSYPTILDFVERISNDVLELNEDSTQRLMARYIAELALQCQVYLNYRPSLVASCVIALALVCTERTDLWSRSLEEATGYCWNDLEDCMLALTTDIHHVRATMPNLKIIMRRYRNAQNGRVSLIQVPRITQFSALPGPTLNE